MGSVDGHTEFLTPFFPNKAHEQSVDRNGAKGMNTQQSANYSEYSQDVSIDSIIAKYKGVENVSSSFDFQPVVDEYEFNLVCNYLEVDNPEAFDSLIYEYYSRIAKNGKLICVRFQSRNSMIKLQVDSML